MMQEWKVAYEGRNLRMAVDRNYKRKVVYISYTTSRTLLQPFASVIETIAAGAPHPGLKCGDVPQFYKRQTQTTV